MEANRSGMFTTFAFWYLGLSNLLPYNAMITAVDFFKDHYGDSVEYYMAVALVLPNLGGLILNASGYLDNVTSDATRVVLPTVFLGVICIAVPFMNMVDSGSIVLILTAAAFLGFFNAVAQGTLYGLSARCEEHHTAALASGGAMAGVIACLIRIATKAALPSTQGSAYIYFGIACAVLMASIPMFYKVNNSKDLKEFLRRSSGLASPLLLSSDSRMEDGEPWTPSLPRTSEQQAESTPVIEAWNGFDGQGDSTPQKTPSGGIESAQVATEATAVGTPDSDMGRPILRTQSSWEVATTRSMPCLATAVFLNYFVTLSVFPGLTSEVTCGDLMSQSWFSVVLITIFNVTDFLGKTLPMQTCFRQMLQNVSPRALLVASIARIAFIPLFVLAYLPRHDAYIGWQLILVIQTLLGLSNGVLGALTMMTAPDEVNDASKGKAGSIMVFMLGLGLSVGSFTGVAIMQVLKHT